MRLAIVDSELCVGCQSCMFACARRHGQGGLAASCIGVKSAGGMRNGFTVVVCRACFDPPCARACPEDALVVRGEQGGVTLLPDRCLGCGCCVPACPYGAVFWDDTLNKPQICDGCGYSPSFCPHGVLAAERRPKKARPPAAAAEVDHAP